MKQRLKLSLMAILLLLTQTAWAQGVSVYGSVTNAYSQPVPGVVVSLFHPVYGRSSPSYTDGWGRYAIHAVPPDQAPYYIEVYWGNQLIYRDPIQVFGPLEWHIMLN